MISETRQPFQKGTKITVPHEGLVNCELSGDFETPPRPGESVEAAIGVIRSMRTSDWVVLAEHAEKYFPSPAT